MNAPAVRGRIESWWGMVTGRTPSPSPTTVRLLDEGLFLPLLCGVLTALWLTWLFGGLAPTPSIHDERSYLLQAQLLASGRIAGPARPLAEFFEQYYVFVTPVTASRYPPGWALALIPGVVMGLPALMPVLLTALTAVILVAGARRIGGTLVALLAWGLWLGMPGELRFRPTLLTEHLSTLLMLAGWWCLVEWRSTRAGKWIHILGGIVAWLVITRPLTGVMYALVAAALVLPYLVRTRAWRPPLFAALAGAPFIALLFWHDHAVTGSAFTTPLKRYSEIYFPFDLPGYGLHATEPERALPPDMIRFSAETAPLHIDFVPRRLPIIAWERAQQLAHHFGGNVGVIAMLIAVAIGLATGGRLARWAALFAAAHFVGYLTFAHWPDWAVYYLEFGPVVATLAALGVARVVGRGWGVAAVAGYAAIVAVAALPAAREYVVDMAAAEVGWASKVGKIPAPAIIFVRDVATHDPEDQMVFNDADLASSPRWLVHDRGPENARLMALAPERTAWLYDEATGSFSRQ